MIAFTPMADSFSCRPPYKSGRHHQPNFNSEETPRLRGNGQCRLLQTESRRQISEGGEFRWHVWEDITYLEERIRRREEEMWGGLWEQRKDCEEMMRDREEEMRERMREVQEARAGEASS